MVVDRRAHTRRPSSPGKLLNVAILLNKDMSFFRCWYPVHILYESPLARNTFSNSHLTDARCILEIYLFKQSLFFCFLQ